MALSTENGRPLGKVDAGYPRVRFTISYRNGCQNNNADALSRMPRPEGDKPTALPMSTIWEGEHSAATPCSP